MQLQTTFYALPAIFHRKIEETIKQASKTINGEKINKLQSKVERKIKKKKKREKKTETETERDRQTQRETERYKTETERQTGAETKTETCLLYTSPSPRDDNRSRMPSSA